MCQLIKFKTTIPPVRNSTSPSPLRLGLTLITLLFGCFALAPIARAVMPPPDGGYTGQNTAEGHQALLSLTTGQHNTADGYRTLYRNTVGNDNTAIGFEALFDNIGAGGELPVGNHNTAIGSQALHSDPDGDENTAVGYQALFNQKGGGFIPGGFGGTAVGSEALYNNTTGEANTAVGVNALLNNATGSFNIALGFNAGAALTTGDNNIDIGNGGVADEANTIRIGTQGRQVAAFIAGISGATLPTGVAVVIDSTTGQLGISATSSARFKSDIKPMDKASEAVLALKPVTFRYKQEIDPKGIRQFGLVAEEVEKVNPALVTRDADGKVYTVRYEAVNAMLLNEFLKEHCKVEQQQRKLEQEKTTIAQLKSAVAKQEVTATEQQKEIAALTTNLKEEAAQIQKVSDQLEVNKPAPQMVLNNH